MTRRQLATGCFKCPSPNSPEFGSAADPNSGEFGDEMLKRGGVGWCGPIVAAGLRACRH